MLESDVIFFFVSLNVISVVKICLEIFLMRRPFLSSLAYVRLIVVNFQDDFEKTDEGTETIELMMDTVLKKPPVYKEPLAFQAQQKLEVPYHRPNPNPHIKPRWITVAGVGPSKDTDSCPLETSVHLTHSEPKLHYQVFCIFLRLLDYSTRLIHEQI